MSEKGAVRERLLRHLLAAGDDDSRLDLEREMLEDDGLFEELAAAEVELVDAYVGGEIDPEASERLAELVGRSERLRETAETTLALGALDVGGADGADRPPASVATTPGTDTVIDGDGRAAPTRSPGGLALGLLVLLALVVGLTVSQWFELREARRSLDRLEATQERLQSDVERLSAEVERLEDERLRERRRRARGGGG
ncbi:MAG: hypothetical protein AAGF23_08410 [Acidobacteriota bacterium]